MAVSSPTGTGSETVTFPGRRLTGCRGWHRFFKLSIYRCGITLKTCSTPRVYILYKNACQPRQPVKISSLTPLRKPPENALAFQLNVLAFDSKRTCVLSKTHLRLGPNAKAFFKRCKKLMRKQENAMQYLSILFICLLKLARNSFCRDFFLTFR